MTGVEAYVASMVADIRASVLIALDEGPMTFGELRSYFVSSGFPTPAVLLERALRQLVSEGRVLEELHHDARARQGGAPAEYRLLDN